MGVLVIALLCAAASCITVWRVEELRTARADALDLQNWIDEEGPYWARMRETR